MFQLYIRGKTTFTQSNTHTHTHTHTHTLFPILGNMESLQGGRMPKTELHLKVKFQKRNGEKLGQAQIQLFVFWLKSVYFFF